MTALSTIGLLTLLMPVLLLIPTFEEPLTYRTLIVVFVSNAAGLALHDGFFLWRSRRDG